MDQEIRWKERFSNYTKALSQLKKFIDKGELNELEQQGLVHAFEYTYELAWNVMKDYFEYQAEEVIRGSRDAIRLSYNRGLIEDGKTWMEMIESRIMSSHTYNEETAQEVVRKILTSYFKCFVDFKITLDKEL